MKKKTAKPTPTVQAPVVEDASAQALMRVSRTLAQHKDRPAREERPSDDIISRLIDLASNREVDVVKIERLIDANERVMKHQAKAAFDAAFAQMQGEIPIISRDGRIEVRDKEDGSRVVRTTAFATNANIQRHAKPVMQKYGFSLRFRNTRVARLLTVTGILSHKAGHSEEDQFETEADDSGKKNAIQALGSARSYGQRYVTRALLNIADESEDDDGESAGDEPRHQQAQGTSPGRSQSYGNHAGDTRPITTVGRDGKGHGQLGRLIMIAKNAGRTDQEVKEWLFGTYGFTSKKEITRDVYDDVIAAIESPGPLGGGAQREPGDEDA